MKQPRSNLIFQESNLLLILIASKHAFVYLKLNWWFMKAVLLHLINHVFLCACTCMHLFRKTPLCLWRFCLFSLFKRDDYGHLFIFLVSLLLCALRFVLLYVATLKEKVDMHIMWLYSYVKSYVASFNVYWSAQHVCLYW